MNVLSAENTDTRAFLAQLIEQISCSDNTIIIIASSRPAPEVCSKYNLALGYDEHFGGELAHIVVMQHVTKSKIDGFIKELQ